MQKSTTANSTVRQTDLTEIFDTVEYPDAYRITYLANSIVFPTYAAIKRDFGLVRAEYILLACLSHYDELTARDVAQISMRPRNTISRAVHRMVAEQLIERRHNRVDKREASLTITKKGEKFAQTHCSLSCPTPRRCFCGPKCARATRIVEIA
jgi:DNA-binding MarR family transcriptional regulator